jgi:hypothetical protein
MATPGKNGRKAPQGSSFTDRLLARKKEIEGAGHEAEDADFSAKYPLLAELVTVRVIDDDKPLEPASLSIWAKQGSWHACVSHKGLKVRWFAEALAFEGLWKALEQAIAHESGQVVSDG